MVDQGKSKFKFLYVVAYGAMFMMGIIDSMRGPMIPGIRATFNVNYSSIGSMFLIASLGFLIATFFSGILCDRLGQKKVMYFGYVCAFFGILGIAYSSNFGIFLLMMGFLNIGMGAIEMSVNSLVSIIFVKNQAVMMNLLHFFYGAGSSVGPRYSGILLNSNIRWQNIYLWSLVIVAGLLIYIVFTRFPHGARPGVRDAVSIMEIVRDRRVLLFGVIAGFYYACELGISYWFVNYLGVVHNMNELSSTFYLSLFYGLFTLGRLWGGFIAEKLGYMNAILVFMIVSFVLFSGGILLGGKYILLISFCGLSYSIVFPTLMTVVIRYFKKSTSSTLGFIVMMGSAINMASNWIIGKVNDLFGVEAGFNILIAFIGILITLIVVLRRMLSAEIYREKLASDGVLTSPDA